LTLPTRQLMRLAASTVLELDERQHFFDPCDLIARGHSLLAQAERDVRGDGEMRKQSVVLEHHVGRPLIGRHPRDVFAGEQNAAFIRLIEPSQHA
jgi:hypothetical protein